MRRTRALTDPTFPHGRPGGYTAGCRTDATCPTTPTCAQVRREDRERKKGKRHEASAGQSQTVRVQKRLEETIAQVGLDPILARTGLTAAAVETVRAWPYLTMFDADAEPLDECWTFFVKGHDNTAPDFPYHGTVTGYSSHYCRCRDCRAGSRRFDKQRALGIITDHTPVVTPGLAEHLRRLLRHGSTYAIAECAGITPNSVYLARDGRPLRAYVARALLAVTPEQVARVTPRVPSTRAHHQLRTMWALGYAFPWQAARLGSRADHLRRLKPDAQVTAELAAAVDALAREVGDTPAGPEHGIDPRRASRTRSEARRAGWYPPAYYDEDGSLDRRSIPDHPWARLDARCDTDLNVALALTTGRSQVEVGKEFGVSDKKAGNIAQAAGLVYVPGTHTLAPEGRPAAARVREVVHAYQDGALGPVEAALTLNLKDAAKINRRHPEVAAWIKQHATTTETTKEAA